MKQRGNVQSTNHHSFSLYRCLQVQDPKPAASANTIVSSNITFARCAGCGGWGKDLLRPSGFCGYCERKQRVNKQPAQQAQQAQQVQRARMGYSSSSSTIVSKTAEVLAQQPKLRMNKKRPGLLIISAINCSFQYSTVLSRKAEMGEVWHRPSGLWRKSRGIGTPS